jgi:ribosome biogenesis GTPase
VNRPALVVARFRRHVVIETQDGESLVCHSASRNIRPLVGDRVEWEAESPGRGIVRAIEPRNTVLTRVDSRGRGQPVAANLTQLVIVVAAEPDIDWLVLDHYLVSAELSRIKPLIIFNKTDIQPQPPPELLAYESIAPVFATSTYEGHIDDTMLEQLRGERSALVGQSGVGKSSLINTLIGDSVQATGELSEKLRQGKHTTTATALYQLKGGGELVDSPGVRRYAPYIEHERDVAGGFREFQHLIPKCRFADCRHLAEPGCAVKAAVDNGKVSRRRYDDYCALYELVATLRRRREP